MVREETSHKSVWMFAAWMHRTDRTTSAMARAQVNDGNIVSRPEERTVFSRNRRMAEILRTWTMMLTAICLMPMMEAGNEPYDDEFPFQPGELTRRPWDSLTWERLPLKSRQHWPVLSDPFSGVAEDSFMTLQRLILLRGTLIVASG